MIDLTEIQEPPNPYGDDEIAEIARWMDQYHVAAKRIANARSNYKTEVNARTKSRKAWRAFIEALKNDPWLACKLSELLELQRVDEIINEPPYPLNYGSGRAPAPHMLLAEAAADRFKLPPSTMKTAESLNAALHRAGIVSEDKTKSIHSTLTLKSSDPESEPGELLRAWKGPR